MNEPCGVITSSVSPGFRLVADPVGKDAARDPLDGDHQILVGRRGAQRIVAPHFLAADLGPQRQMLPGLEAERVLKLLRHFEADRIGFVGLGHDLRDP